MNDDDGFGAHFSEFSPKIGQFIHIFAKLSRVKSELIMWTAVMKMEVELNDFKRLTFALWKINECFEKK